MLGLPGYGQFYKGNHITTMTYDFWRGSPATRTTASASRSRRSTSRRSRTRSTTTGATRPASRPSAGLQKKQALSTFNNHIEILAMVEDTHDGEFLAPPPTGSHVRPNAGPVGVGHVQVRAVGPVGRGARGGRTRRSQSVVAAHGPRPLHEAHASAASFAAHPLGGCRMADSKDLGVVDHRNEVFGNEGLFCIDSSAIPTSLGVNPSLTISAVSERAVAQLIDRARRLRPARQAGGIRAGRARRHPRAAHRAGAAPLATTRSTRRSAATASAGYEDAAAGVRRPFDHCVTGRSCSSPSTSMSTRSLKNAR